MSCFQPYVFHRLPANLFLGCLLFVGHTAAEKEARTSPVSTQSVQLSSQGISSTPLTQDEQDALRGAFEGEDDDSNEFCYYLSGIMVKGPKQWTIWLNENSYTHSMTIPDMKVLNVEARRVQIQTLKRPEKPTQWVDFNQTYCPDTNSVLPGDQRK